MTVSEFISKLENGAAHLLLFSSETGSIILKTIWYNTIPSEYLGCEIDKIIIKDYEVRLGVK